MLLLFNKSESLECAKVVVWKLGAILFYSGIHFKNLKFERGSEQAHSTKDKRIRLIGTCRKVPLVQNGISFILENAYLTYLGSWRSVTQKTLTRFCQPAILKRVSGFCNDIFYEDGTLTHRPLPNPEGQALQFIWPFTHNLPSTV